MVILDMMFIGFIVVLLEFWILSIITKVKLEKFLKENKDSTIHDFNGKG